MENKKYDYTLDIIRCIAILIIFTAHFSEYNGLNTSWLYGYKNGGWGSVGTGIFFVLSGYCIHLRDYDFSSFSGIIKFYKKRMLAIFPLLWLTFFVGYICKSLILHDFTYGGHPAKILISLVGFDGYMLFNGGTNYYAVGEWFTAIIILIYLLFPLVSWLFERARVSSSLVFLLIYVANIVLKKGNRPPDATLCTGLFLFWIGMMVHEYWPRILGKKQMIIPICIVIIATILFIKLPYIGAPLMWKNLLGLSIFLLLKLSMSKLVFSNERVSDLLKFESRICFSIYLCHHAMILWIPMVVKNIVDLKQHLLLQYVIVLILVELVAILLYKISLALCKIFTQKN